MKKVYLYVDKVVEGGKIPQNEFMKWDECHAFINR